MNNALVCAIDSDIRVKKQKSFDFFRANYPINRAEIIKEKEIETFI